MVACLTTSERKTSSVTPLPPQGMAPGVPGRPWGRDTGTDGHRGDGTQVSKVPTAGK